MPASVTPVYSSGGVIDGILHSVKWDGPSLTYSFPTNSDQYSSYGGYQPFGFSQLNSFQIAAARASISTVQDFTNLTFVEIVESTSVHATLRFAGSNNTFTAEAYLPDSAGEEPGDMWFSPAYFSGPVVGNYAYCEGFIHELGHALGLVHGHDGANNPFGGLPYNWDSQEYSVMTYRDYIGDNPAGYSDNETWGNPQSFMMLDIQALQYLYGADYGSTGSAGAGSTVYTFSTTTGEMFINGVGTGTPGGNRILRTIWDGNGIDTYDLRNYSTNMTIDLRPGFWSTFDRNQLADLDGDDNRLTHLAQGNVANALLFNGDVRSLIENAVGGYGNDLIVGNETSNTIYGMSGNDNIYGGAGDDFLYGGVGDDNLDGGAGADTFDGWVGFDIVFYSQSTSGITADLGNIVAGTGDAAGDTFSYVDGIWGSSYDDRFYGDQWGNALYGRDGADFLYGREGNDQLYGGDGNDTLDGGAGADVLDGGLGFDFVSYSQATAAVTADLGNIVAGKGEAAGDTFNYVDGIWGSSHDDLLYGDQWSNVLYGQDGSDNLYGRAGNDQIYGGNGDDHIDGGVGADLIDGGSGFDTVYYTQASSGVRVDLAGTLSGTGDAAGDTLVSIEKVVGSSYADDLYGDQGNNTLVGGAGNDWLSGRDGNDSLYGGAGIDVFVVAPNNGSDTIFDFQDNIDKIDLRSWGFASISQAVSYIADTGPDLRFDFSDGSHLTVLNVANFTDLANDILIA